MNWADGSYERIDENKKIDAFVYTGILDDTGKIWVNAYGSEYYYWDYQQRLWLLKIPSYRGTSTIEYREGEKWIEVYSKYKHSYDYYINLF